MVNPHIRESWPENLCSLVAETVGVWTLCGSLSGSFLIISDLPLVCLNSQSNKILLILYFLILLSEFILAEKKVSLRPVEWTRLRGVLIARAQSLPIKGSSTLSPFRQFIVSSLRRLSLFPVTKPRPAHTVRFRRKCHFVWEMYREFFYW